MNKKIVEAIGWGITIFVTVAAAFILFVWIFPAKTNLMLMNDGRTCFTELSWFSLEMTDHCDSGTETSPTRTPVPYSIPRGCSYNPGLIYMKEEWLDSFIRTCKDMGGRAEKDEYTEYQWRCICPQYENK